MKRRFKGFKIILWGVIVLSSLWLPVYLAAQSKPAAQPENRGVPNASLDKLTTLLKSIQEKNGELDERAKELDSKEGRLKIIERDVQALVAKYVKLRKEVGEKLMERSEEEDQRLARVAKMLESMPPKKAVSQMERMDEAVVLALFTKIKEKKAALILSEMNPAMAAELSEKLVAKEP